MKTNLIVLLALISLNIHTQDIYISDLLEKKWETPKELKVPESVCYDANNTILYVSNIEGSPGEKDNKGFISKVSLDGEIVQLKWVSELNAPKGMGIVGDKLYVSDIDQVVEISIKKGNITARYDVKDAKFLNDIAIGQDGMVFISDMADKSIYLLKDGKINLWLKSDKLENINGLFVKDEKVLAGIQDRVVSIDIKNKTVDNFVLNTGGIDGIVPDGEGNYLVSDWRGNIHLIHPDKKMLKLLDTTPSGVNAADIEFIIDKKLLLVPTFNDNRVTCYKLVNKI